MIDVAHLSSPVHVGIGGLFPTLAWPGFPDRSLFWCRSKEDNPFLTFLGRKFQIGEGDFFFALALPAEKTADVVYCLQPGNLGLQAKTQDTVEVGPARLKSCPNAKNSRAVCPTRQHSCLGTTLYADSSHVRPAVHSGGERREESGTVLFSSLRRPPTPTRPMPSGAFCPTVLSLR